LSNLYNQMDKGVNDAELSKVGVLGLQPLRALPVYPLSVTFLPALVLRVNEDTDSMLAVISPATNVHGTVSPSESSLTVLLAILEVTFIASPVIPGLYSSALDCSKAELALIDFVNICKVVLAMPLELTIYEFTLIVAAIGPFKAALALFLAFIELADIASAAAIIPCLLSHSMLRIIKPFTSVAHALRCVEESTTACRLVVAPLTDINIATCLDHLSAAMELPVAEHSFVFRAIGIQQDTKAVLLLRLLLGPTNSQSTRITYH
jgi:hypothetical protein